VKLAPVLGLGGSSTSLTVAVCRGLMAGREPRLGERLLELANAAFELGRVRSPHRPADAHRHRIVALGVVLADAGHVLKYCLVDIFGLE